MRVWLLAGVFFSTLLEAADNSFSAYLDTVPLLVLAFVVMAIIAAVLGNKTRKQAEELSQKDEKITFLRRVNAENEHKYTAKMHEDEKEILSLRHTIETLEKQIKEGTKNQVVQKIELQQRKRENDLNRLGLAD